MQVRLFRIKVYAKFEVSRFRGVPGILLGLLKFRMGHVTLTSQSEAAMATRTALVAVRMLGRTRTTQTSTSLGCGCGQDHVTHFTNLQSPEICIYKRVKARD